MLRLIIKTQREEKKTLLFFLLLILNIVFRDYLRNLNFKFYVEACFIMYWMNKFCQICFKLWSNLTQTLCYSWFVVVVFLLLLSVIKKKLLNSVTLILDFTCDFDDYIILFDWHFPNYELSFFISIHTFL